MDSNQPSPAIAESLRAAQQKLSERFGVFYSPASFCGAVAGGLELDQFEAMEDRFQVFSVTTSDGFRLYPGLQLASDGEFIDGLGEILEILMPVTADGWAVLYWLTAVLPEWDNRTPAQVLAEGKPAEVESMIRLALADAEGWAAARG